MTDMDGAMTAESTPDMTEITEICYNEWIGDEFCDDMTNNVKCNFDGGDCCGTYVNEAWCTECLCLNDSKTTKTSELIPIITETTDSKYFLT